MRRSRRVAAGVVVALAVVIGPILCLRLPFARQLVAVNVNRVLASTFVGHVVVDRIGAIGWTGVDGIEARVDTADGQRLLHVEDGLAHISTWTLLRSLVGQGDIVVDLPDVSLGSVEALLDPDEGGKLRIAGAFQPRPNPTRGEARGVRVRIERALLRHATVHIHPNAAPPLDADLSGAEASLLFDGGKLTIDLPRGPLELSGLPEGVRAVGRLEAHLTEPPLRVQARWKGAVGTIRHQAELTYDDGRIDAVVDAERATPEQMRQVWPECPFRAAMDAHAEVHGVLSHANVLAHAGLGPGTVDVTGTVALGPPLRGTLHVDGRRLDVQALLASAAHTDLAATGDVTFNAKPTGAIDATGTLEVAQGVWGSTPVPPGTLRGEFSRSDSGEPSGRAELTVRAPYAPTVLTARLAPQPGSSGGSLAVTFEAQSGAARLQDLPALNGVAAGNAHARLSGTLDLAAKTIDADLQGTLDDFSARGVSLGHASIAVHAGRKLDAPSFNVAIDAERLDAGPLELSALRGRARLAIDQGVTLQDVDVDVTGDAAPAHAHADVVQVSKDDVRVEGAVLEGFGEPLTASVRASQSRVVVQAKSTRIELDRLHSFARTPVRRGILSLDVDTTVGAGAAAGHFAATVRDAELYDVRHANAQIDVLLRGRHASGRATATVEDMAALEVSSSSVDIGQGPLLTPAPWRKTWGAIEFRAHADLARVAARLSLRGLSFDEMTGTLDVDGSVSRDSAEDATPAVEVTAKTTDLVLAGERGARPWRLEGINPTVHATADGNTGRTVLEAQVSDPEGVLATLAASSNAVPYAAIFSDANPTDALRSMPFDARLDVPLRPVDTLPSVLGLGELGGDLRAKLSWHGALVAPAIDAVATLTGGRVAPALVTRALDVTVRGHYDGTKLDATLQAARLGHNVLDSSVRVEARASDVLAGLGGRWRASARAKLDEFPLQGIAALEDRQVRGKVTGEAVLEGLHEDARASVVLSAQGLKVGDVACRSSTVKLSMDGRSLAAQARLDQDDGFVEGHARLGMHWGAAITPTIDPSQPFDASLSAKQFRAALLWPLVSRWLTELDGRIDANVHVATTAADRTVRPEGTLTYSGGTFELRSFGGQFRDASATLTMTPDRLVRLQDAVAHGLNGTVEGAATARLDGASLSSVRARVQVPAKDPLPLVFDGVKLGVLDGAFDIAADRGAEGRTTWAVNSSGAHVQLTSNPSSVDVQSLGDVAGVKVGVVRGERGFVEVPLDGARAEEVERSGKAQPGAQVAVKLSDVQVSRGTDLDVRLEGQPLIVMGAKTQVTGQIRMQRGNIDVYGKSFRIDKGTVTFVGDDPTNPQVVLTASWAAPDGVTRVYADFIGPLKTGKVKLRSEPAKPQSEILALVLFGTTDDQKSSPSGTSAQVSPAAAVAGGAATQPINKALGGLDRALGNLGMAGGISTKIDTSQTTPRPEVEVQIARDISLQIAWVLGVPPPGTNPDSTLVTLDWHFLRKWSLETTVGDMGTSILDVVWQHRY